MNFARGVKLLVVVSASVIAMLGAEAQAADNKTSANNKDYIAGYAGYFDVIRGDHGAAQFGVEYRGHPFQYTIRPIIGVNVTTDSSLYGYAGFHLDAELIKDQLYLSPNFAAGFYRKNSGRDLGGTVEFRSGIELAYQMPNEHRVGVAFNHISNASLYRHNPGSETALISYSVPIN